MTVSLQGFEQEMNFGLIRMGLHQVQMAVLGPINFLRFDNAMLIKSCQSDALTHDQF
jgi:hypothetical protein